MAAALAALLLAFVAGAQSSRDAQRKLDKAQRELKAVAAERRKIEGQRGDASKQLRAVDEQLGHSSRALHDTEAQLAREQASLAQLRQRRTEMQGRLGAQRTELATLLRAAYTVGGDAPLKLLLAQDKVADASRVLTWHRYLQRDRAQRIATLAAELQALEALEQRIAEQQRALDATRERQRAQLAQLQGDRKQRARTVAQLDTRYKDKRSREKALGSDVAGLKKLLAQLRAAAARAEAERRAAAERAARAAREAGKTGPRPPPPVVANATPVHVGGLGWPLSGNLLAGYGGTLPDGGNSSGLLIGAPTGSTVKAVANGKVVFADWMNGYGLILIIDHGNGYMSLYARNEALLRDAGDDVKRGDAVASVGSSGGAGPPALYFELRRNGDPVNPNTWLQKQ
ncbi:peptidoglycan DD-metalloendopeptidase family protein [Luteimonas sp. 50]|uniref:Peptidoglycan DD-metalloendopeptidase family protein n=2 Tax=Cognatiluteimonas sedimenti TaxID=2927791 RepID=A0ABT0A688_9GAMM|nr:peptidoglycan DD-metalloendopeptidase family protein [Lysobacter sedimenti]MCJ0826484.1 peptidoglycan DD-metalloendopeptidase family protein [Lysobacter sedimenti]